ncbi:sulfurtransferase-like selenium metabolism protein YedF [Olsenella sp. YH-ols2217]|uniref:Sulfurtransferase-like selenium metabolism protein YedF n=1 Tax=Kribbibacterium absianum TaxID=3044210 RepID=A0ABT6ZHV4_9ACTN|nr:MULTISPECIES: sulfurtransferase-like selenium metabolism protein YedF [unclassified Olsenella]MDJ1121141.1 sulfurtransferase-like selenium metabolism protein YedF [Olsenella sp. YH-ols2216]MDJ1128632.1 sulfurtransferase-like selenium metabolism protein YedF [Olsenella sp. YH-ols2217]
MQIDARNVTCPKPVIMTLEALRSVPAGGTLEVLVNDEVALGNLTRLANDKGLKLLVEDEGDHKKMVMTVEGAAVDVSDAEAEAAQICVLPGSDLCATVVAFDKDVMGSGNDELGHILIKGLIYALAHGDKVPETALFYNGGARLTCEGSESVEDIQELERRGCRVLTCGTCLDFYGIRDQLQVGGVTNLYEIAQVITGQPGVMVI